MILMIVLQIVSLCYLFSMHCHIAMTLYPFDILCRPKPGTRMRIVEEGAARQKEEKLVTDVCNRRLPSGTRK